MGDDRTEEEQNEDLDALEERDERMGYEEENVPLPPGEHGPPTPTYSTTYDRAQDARDAERDARLEELEQIQLLPGDVAANPGAQEAAPAQRLRIHVPTVKSTLSLGAKAAPDARRPEDAGAPNFHGFGVHTEGHLFLTASKDAASSTGTFQAKGNVVVQSERGQLWLGAAGDTNVASNSNSYLMGGTGVVIAGGSAVAWGPNGEPDGTEPQPPAWMSGFAAAGSAINRVWAGVDAVAAVGTGVKSMVSASTSRPLTWGDAVPALNFALGNTAGAVVSSLGAANEDPIGGTVIHGTGGVIVGSTHTMGLYSVTGTAIISVLGITQLAPSIGITGINDVGIDSAKSVELKSRDTASMTGRGKTLVASRKADLQLLGKTVFVGSEKGDEGAQQDKTNKVELYAESVVNNAGHYQTLVDEKYVVDAKNLLLGCGDIANIVAGNAASLVSTKVELRAVKEVSLHVPGGMGVHVQKNELFLGVNTATPGFDKKAAGKGKRGKEKSGAIKEARAAWEAQVETMKAGDVGIKFKKAKIQMIVQGNRFHIDSGKFKTGSLVWKK